MEYSYTENYHNSLNPSNFHHNISQNNFINSNVSPIPNVHTHNIINPTTMPPNMQPSFIPNYAVNSSRNIPIYTPSILPQHQNYCRPLLYQQSDPRFKSNNQSSTVAADALDKKSDDELWIETYLSKLGKINLSLQSNIEILIKKPKPVQNLHKKSLKIHVAKSLLRRCLILLQELEKVESYLRENFATIPSSEWKQKTVEIGQQKDEFTALLSQFEDSSILEQLRRTLNKRKKKRLSQRRKKITRQEEYVETLKNRQLMHKNIDRLQENAKAELEKAKREESLKKDADCILAEVTKKKSEARKQLSILASLVKLRSVREKNAIQRGEKISLEDTNVFKSNTEKLQKMWEDALNRYSEEEKALRATLEESVPEEVDVIAVKNQEIIEEWKTVLFGPTNFIPNETYWALTVAEKDLGTFIAIRKSWDTFLVKDNNENGSKIPIGWVLPDSNSTDWAQYLKNSNS